MTRQRKWQLKQSSNGLCQQCGEPNKSGVGVHCEPCRVKIRKRKRDAAGCGEWRPGSKGRPPLTKRGISYSVAAYERRLAKAYDALAEAEKRVERIHSEAQ